MTSKPLGSGVQTMVRAKLALATTAALATLGLHRLALADGTFDGGEVSATQTRHWLAAVNWGLDTLPLATESLDFTNCGDGTVLLGGAVHSHPTVKFDDWTSYTLAGPGTLEVTSGFIAVGATVSSTNGSDYFADGQAITSDLSLPAPASTISFTNATTGALRISGKIMGGSPLTLTAPAASTNVHGVYFSDPNPGFFGSVSVGSFTAARLLDAGRSGTAPLTLNGGSLDILSEVAQSVANPIMSAVGNIHADHNYTASPTPAFAPGTVHSLGPVNVDNPTMLGGFFDADVTFGSDNGYNFKTPFLKLSNGGFFAAPGTRSVGVENGDARFDYAGSVRQTGPNGLNKMLVTTTVGVSGGGASFADANPVGPALPLVKHGGGVLYINGDNQVSSTAPKFVFGGTLRFDSPISYGTTTGVAGGPADPVTLSGAGAGPVSAAMGVNYVTGVPGNLATTGGTPGQSGVFDVDFVPGNGAGVALPIINTGGALTALRIGSSGTGLQFGPIAPYTSPVGVNTYFLGGGGGTLTISSFMGPGPGPGATNIEMGTSGDLIPGTVELTPGVVGIGAAGAVKIRSGTLKSTGAAFPWPGIMGTSLGAYSTTLSTGAAYGGAPAATPHNGPGQILLSAAIQGGGGYVYGPGGGFGGAGLGLEGGAIGWTGAVPIPAPPGVYGATLASTLYSSPAIGPASVATNILHLGGEGSSGTMFVMFPITNNGATPVALLKSGISSSLDLTPMPAHFYTGGTGILSGEVIVNMPPQLSTGPITIADGGILHIVPGGGAAPFKQLLRVANGPNARASVVTVDPGVAVTFDGTGFGPFVGAIEADVPGSLLEKAGGGIMSIFPPAYPGINSTQTWGVKMNDGVLELNHLPGTTAAATTGAVVIQGGLLHLVSPFAAPGIPIPPATQFDPTYGFSALSSYAGTSGDIHIDDGAFFRLTGTGTGSWMGKVNVTMGPTSVFKIGSNAAGTDTRGTGSIQILGGNVQFTSSVPHILLPSDGAFTLALNDNLFSGTTTTTLNGNLLFNNLGSAMTTIDAAEVSNGSPPVVSASTWTIQGTGATSWSGLVVKGSTQATPGGGGPFTSGTVNFNRCVGAPDTVAAGSLFKIDAGVVNAGNTGDPFTQNVGVISSIDVENNASGPGIGIPPTRGLNITAGNKAVGNLTVTGFTGAAPALGVSSTSVFTASSLTANYVRQSKVDINGTGSIVIRTDPGSGTCSRVNTLNIAGGIGAWTAKLDMNNDDMIIDYAGATPFATVFDQIKTAYALGPWTGNGITSGAAAATSGSLHKTALGYGENSSPALSLGAFDGQAVDLTSIIIRYVYSGDANLDGTVNSIDFNILAANFGLAGTTWTRADFNYDTTTDTVDFNLLVSNFGLTLPASGAGAVGSVVPESSALCPAGLAFTQFLARRRRRCGN